MGTRRIILLLKKFVPAGLLIAVWAVGCGIIYQRMGGAFQGEPSEMWSALTPGARALIEHAFEDIIPGRLVDYHVHIAGVGSGDSGIFLNPSWLSRWHPIKRGRTRIYMSASGVKNEETADRDYVLRLVDLLENFPVRGKFHILALDKNYRPDGTVDLDRTSLYVPNDYVAALAEEYSDFFIPVISIHPYRADALLELDRWARRGYRYIKWLPNTMGIDPSSDRLDAFYRRMRKYDMILLTHTGHELAVDAEDQHPGNPLLLRKPLEMGVRVVALHAASLGKYVDPERSPRQRVAGFDLLLRLMEEPKYKGLLFAEISAIIFFNHLPHPLRTLLEREDLHDRLINGSDYPLPGINMLTQTRQLVKHGFISPKEREQLNEIYSYNPLIFDFVVKRTVRHPSGKKRFPASVFMVPGGLRAVRGAK